MSAIASSSSSGAASSSAAPAAQSQRIGIEQLLAARRASPAVRVVVDAPALSIGCAAFLALRAVAIGQPAALVGTRTLMGMFPVAFPYFGASPRRRSGEHAERGARDGDAGAAMSDGLSRSGLGNKRSSLCKN